ncbi:MAG: hypothetical protein U5L72_14435 [Bacteroidales bacterium]|nr:hypothetical protein [Bacteroidales bacterium]
MRRSFSNRRNSFTLFEELARPHTDDPLVSRIMAELKPVRDFYASVGTSLTFEEIEAMKKAVTTVRSELIK